MQCNVITVLCDNIVLQSIIQFTFVLIGDNTSLNDIIEKLVILHQP